MEELFEQKAITDVHTVELKELTMFLIKLMAAGVLVSAVLVAPGLGMLVKYFPNANHTDRQRIRRRVRYLGKQRYFETRNGKDLLTAKGLEFLSEEMLFSLEFKKPARWDKQWFVVMFDIPARKGRIRHMLRAKLVDIGFVMYQDSVYIFPYECRSLIKEIEAILGLQNCIQTLVVIDFDGREKLQSDFNL